MTDWGRRVVYHLEEEIPFRGDTVTVVVEAMWIFEDDFDDEGCPAQYSYLFEFKLYTYDEAAQNYETEINDTLTEQENVDLQAEIDELAADAAAYAAERKAER